MDQSPVSTRPLVSVAIVNFNGGAFLLDTVRSVLASTVPIEVWVVDNASSDGSVLELERRFHGDPRLHILHNPENLGFARANNIALRQAGGDFLLLLNPDCIVEPDTLERMVEALLADPSAGMAGCLIVNPDGSEQAGCRRSIPTPWTGLLRSLNLPPALGVKGRATPRVDLSHTPLPEKPIYVEAISGAFMLVRRSALEQAGLMDESYFLHCEDLDWCKTFEEAGWRILFVPGVSIVHHKGACSNDRPLFVLWHKHRGMVRFYNKFLSSRYAAPLNVLVVLGVWLRFAAAVPLNLARRLFSRRAAAQVPAPAPSVPAEPLPLFRRLAGLSVLVTGGSGFIGSRLVDELIRQGAEVHVLTRRQAPPDLWPPGKVRFRVADLTDADSLRHVCDGIHTLFHLASHTHVLDAPAEENSGHLQVTEQGTLAMLQVARDAGVRRFVFVSSVKAMGEESERCLDESVAPRPETPYGMAKLHAERAVLEAARDGGMQATVLRLPMVYGPGNKGNLPRMVEAIRRGRFPPLPAVSNRRSMLHVDDAVQAMLLAAVRDEAGGQVYIVTDGRDYSTREIHSLISAQLGKRPPRWRIPLALLQMGARVGDLLLKAGIPMPLNSASLRKLLGSAWFSNAKIRRELGYRPRYDLQRALPEMVKESGDSE